MLRRREERVIARNRKKVFDEKGRSKTQQSRKKSRKEEWEKFTTMDYPQIEEKKGSGKRYERLRQKESRARELLASGVDQKYLPGTIILLLN